MFNSELVIADLSSINCAWYSFTQFQFILANRSTEKKKKQERQKGKTYILVSPNKTLQVYCL